MSAYDNTPYHSVGAHDNAPYHDVGAYDNAPYHSGMNEALTYNKKSNTRAKWIAIGCIIAVIGIIAIGVGVGVTVSKNNSKSSTKTANNHNSNSNSNPDTNAKPNQTDPNDPSTFVKDPNLHQSFYGLAYTPEGSQLSEGCSVKLASVITDVQLMSQLTTRIRLYGADCNQTAMVLEAIKQTKVNLQVYVGNYPTPDDPTAYTRQRDELKAAIQTYGVDHIAGMTVGNEYMLNYLNSKQATDPNSAVGNQGAQQLIADISDTRSMLQGLNLPKTIPVGNSDAGSYFNTQVLQAVDYGMANVHPWFANVSANDAANWTMQFFQDTNVGPAAALSNHPQMYIAETGWPTQSSDAADATNGPGVASEAGLQTFMDTFVCQANSANIGYFFFEYFDEPWKDKDFGGVEGWWGLFHANRTMKNIQIPNCQSP